jgi:MoaA/NifB/PqqE/SkfB family radical SAM enzyme
MALGVDHLTVSVWAGTANGYVATHPKRSPGDFYRLRERLAYLNRNKNRVPYTKVYHVLSKKNAAEFRALFNFALDTRSDSVEFALLDPIPGKTDCLLLDEEELAALKKDALELRRRVEDSGLDRRITLFGYDDFLRRIEDGVRASRGYYDHRAVEEIPCTIGWTFSRINADGEVNGCLKSHRLPLGNVLETRFSEIWNGPRQREFRTRTLERRPNDPFFRKIGNDTECAEGCMKSCDDIGRNLALHRKLQALSLPVRTALAVMAWPYRRGILPPRRPAPFRGAGKDDPAPAAPSSALAGYRDGQKAFTGPAAVALDVTNRCRARCLPCFTRSPLLHRDRPPSEWHERELPQSRVFELFEELESMGTRELRFSGGGDPLAHPEIASMVAGAKRRKFKVSITTALFRPHPETWERIVHTAPPEINVSLLAATPETYIRQHPGATARDFEWILGQVSRLAAAGKTRIVLTQVLNKGNLHEIRRMADLARELNVFAVHFTPMDAVCPELVPLALTGADLEQVSRELRRAASSITRRSSLRIEGGERFRPPGKASQPPPPCSVGWHFCRVLASGDVVPCCKAPRWILGNLYDNTFSDIWHGERYADFRVRSRRPECFPESFAGLECASRCDNAADNLHFYLEHIRPGTK